MDIHHIFDEDGDPLAALAARLAESKGTYDVFLSFRGEDTRNVFVCHLYGALVVRGIHTFLDDERLYAGKPIRPELLKAIDDSKIAIVVFSKNYANSSWCLDELVRIVEAQPKKAIIPVFYHVDPSDVRKQKNDVADALSQAIDKVGPEMVPRWKEALTEAARYSGFDVAKIGNEYVCVQRIAAGIYRELNSAIPRIREDLVGMEWRVNKVLELLRVGESDKVVVVGIWGMGGSGKTTIASVVFDKLPISHTFAATCFLKIPIGEHTENGLIDLQRTLLSDTLKVKKDEICIRDSRQGANMIRQRLETKKVLIVLDNVDHQKQLNALAADPKEMFGPGSRVIITTRDNQLLNYVDATDCVLLLNETEAMQLFCWHAFRRSQPHDDFVSLSSDIVKYAGGLPLALEVLGSHLVGLSPEEWSSEIRKLQKIPHDDILSKLKISYDGLDDTNKRIFLDVACFFRGWHVEKMMKMLDCFDCYFGRGISPLFRKSLVSVDEMGRIEIHDLVHQMGRDIVRVHHPGSRLWEKEDILDALIGKRDFVSVEAIVGEFGTSELIVSNEAFKRMKKLRVLVLPLNWSLDSGYLPNDLQYIRWTHYPGDSLPASFEGRNLAGLIMWDSDVVEPITGQQMFEKLRIMDLSGSHRIIRTLDFSKVPCLVELHMSLCKNLVEVHPSFGVHNKLQLVDFSDCNNLQILPKSLQMEELKCLNMSGCNMLENFPEIEGTMTRLKELNLSWTKITRTPDCSKLPCLEELRMSECRALVEVHSQIEFHQKFRVLDFKYCGNLKVFPGSRLLESLECLNLRGCVKLEKFPDIRGNTGMIALKMLNLSSTQITQTLDYSKLPCLEKLELAYCWNLVEVHPSFGVHKKLQFIGLHGCENLKILSRSLQMESLKSLDLSGCKKLEKFPEIDGSLTALEELNLSHTGITRTPDFSKAPCLETLTMEECKNLVEIHSSFGVHRKLQLVDLKGCENLNIFPRSLQMGSLKRLDLRGCKKLEKFPEIEVNNVMTALEVLNLSGTGITGLPYSIRHLTGLQNLNISNTRLIGHSSQLMEDSSNNYNGGVVDAARSSPSSIISTELALPNHSIDDGSFLLERICRFTMPASFNQLKTIKLSSLNMTRFMIPESGLPSLQHLDLSRNPLQELVISEWRLTQSLKELDLRDHIRLRSNNSERWQELQGPSGVALINYDPASILISEVDFFDWEALSGVLHKRETELAVLLPTGKIPDCFKFQSAETPCQVILSLTATWHNPKYKGFAFCISIRTVDPTRVRKLWTPFFNVNRGGMERFNSYCWELSGAILLFLYIPCSSQCFQGCLSNPESTEAAQQFWLLDVCDYSFMMSHSFFKIEEWGIRLVYDDEDEGHDTNYADIRVIALPPEPRKGSRLEVLCSGAAGQSQII